MGKKKGPKPRPVHERFWEKVNIRTETECWPWKEFVNNKSGYGQFNQYHGKPIGAHRMAYMLSTGETLEELDFICHICHNRVCCNPSHLYKGDAKSNASDMKKAGRATLNKSKPKGYDSPHTILVDENEIRRLWESGLSGVKIAKMFEVGRTTIGRIVHDTRFRG